MNLPDTACIFRFHKNLTEQYGMGTIGALGWKTAGGQQARFKILTRIADLNNYSVLDAGCGHGDLREFLGRLYPAVEYYGVEQIPAILNVAVSRYSHLAKTWFFQGDFSASVLPGVDYLLACGALSYRNSDSQFVLKMIEKLFSGCRLGFGFNLLSKTDFDDGLLAAYNPDHIKAFCLTLTHKVILHKGYFEDDFTIFMYH